MRSNIFPTHSCAATPGQTLLSAFPEEEIRHALRSGQMTLHYQPQMRAATGSVAGVEALVRWNHPNLGPIPPAVFIPTAERSSLITDIGAWTIQTAIAQAVFWTAIGVDLRVAVNVSGKQFDSRLVHTVEQALVGADLPPERLEIEITEGFLIGDLERATDVLSSLRALGVRIAIDDFGTGWSTLQYLSSFPVDVLKIDRAFISGHRFDARIVRSIVAIAGEFGVETVAEGMETKEQLRLITELGCDYWQGFLHSPAVRADLIPSLLTGPTVGLIEPQKDAI